MTISTGASQTLVSGNGATQSFSFNFVADSASDISVTSIASSGTMTLLTPSQYSLSINAPTTNQLWGIGGTIVYPLSGSPIPAGQSLLIQRILPLTQTTSVQNQGNYYAQVTEEALDTLCMEIQQVSARTGQMRGTWATGVSYNFGDSVVDGANGANTGNYYTCVIANTSGVWATDLANGDWSLALNIQNINAVIGAYLPLIGGTISGNLTVGGTLTPTGGIAASTVAGSSLISGGVTNAKMAPTAGFTVKGNNVSATGNVTDISLGSQLSLSSGSLDVINNNYRSTAQVNVTSNATTGVVVTGLTATLASNSNYIFQGHITGTSSASGGMKIGIGGTANASAFTMTVVNWAASTPSVGTTTTLGALQGNTAAVQDSFYVGEISVATGGTFIVSIAQNQSSPVATSAFVGSTLQIQQTAN